MIRYDYDTMSTPVFPDADADAPSPTRALQNRQEWLDAKGRQGWGLVSTVTVPGVELTTIVDTMSRINPENV